MCLSALYDHVSWTMLPDNNYSNHNMEIVKLRPTTRNENVRRQNTIIVSEDKNFSYKIL